MYFVEAGDTLDCLAFAPKGVVYWWGLQGAFLAVPYSRLACTYLVRPFSHSLIAHMIEYLKNNTLQGIKTSPLRSINFTLYILCVYGAVAVFVGFASGLFAPGMIVVRSSFLLLLPLFVFPSFLEEFFFRGVLIPNGAKERGWKFITSATLASSALFVLWHPLNALTINKGAQGVFLDPYFLLIVFCLGLACSLSYIYSRSLWAPVLIHWFTVCVWVIFLGGRNLLLE